MEGTSEQKLLQNTMMMTIFFFGFFDCNMQEIYLEVDSKRDKAWTSRQKALKIEHGIQSTQQ